MKARCLEQATDNAEAKAMLKAKGILKVTRANATRVAEVDDWVRNDVGEASQQFVRSSPFLGFR